MPQRAQATVQWPHRPPGTTPRRFDWNSCGVFADPKIEVKYICARLAEVTDRGSTRRLMLRLKLRPAGCFETLAKIGRDECWPRATPGDSYDWPRGASERCVLHQCRGYADIWSLGRWRSIAMDVRAHGKGPKRLGVESFYAGRRPSNYRFLKAITYSTVNIGRKFSRTIQKIRSCHRARRASSAA